MDETRRDLLHKLALLAMTPAIVAASPSAVPGGYTRTRTGDLPKIIRKPSEFGKLVLPFSKTNTSKPDTYPTYPRGDYKSVGLTPYMPTTGERQEIGLVTEAQGAWLCGGSPSTMLAQAEAHADVPVHFGKVDLEATPNATAYAPDKGSPYFSTKGHPVTPDVAHYPALCYVPYLATGDIRYLEELQAAATYKLIAGPAAPGYRPLMTGQPRAFAWRLRDLAACYLATPEAVPGHLLPRSYWKRRLDEYRDAFKASWVDNPHPLVQSASAAVADIKAWVAPWEQDYLGFVLGWMVYAGLEDWRDNYQWSVRQAIRRAAFGAAAIGYHWFASEKTTDLASLIAANQPATDRNYRAYWRGNLKVAVLNGVPGAQQAFGVADGLAKGFVPYRWAV